MPVVEVRPAAVDLGDGERQLGLDSPPFELEGTDTLVEVGVGAVEQLLHQRLGGRGFHTAHPDEGVSQG